MPSADFDAPDSWPTKAYKNLPFLNSPAARLIRVQCELTEPADRFAKHRIEDTIVFFGSARTIPLAQAEAELKELEAEIAESATPDDPLLQDRLAHAKRRLRSAPYYDKTQELARRLTEWSKNLRSKNHRFIVCSGAGPGIMEAANRGAHDASGYTIGLGISLPFETGINPYCSRELSFEFHYFFVRKYWFLYHAKALIVFPGGFGTMDELFELLTLIQTKKIKKVMPIVLFGKDFWNQVINFEALYEWGVVSKEDLNLFRVCDEVSEAFEWITAELTKHHLSDD